MDKKALLLEQFEDRIQKVIDGFVQKFGVRNPLGLWRNGFIDRIGFLDNQETIEYSLHGAGCTVEFSDGAIVSFDFGLKQEYTFDRFKFNVFLESIGEPTHDYP